MLQAGLLSEVRSLLEAGIDPRATSMQAIGYREALRLTKARCLWSWLSSRCKAQLPTVCQAASLVPAQFRYQLDYAERATPIFPQFFYCPLLSSFFRHAPSGNIWV